MSLSRLSTRSYFDLSFFFFNDTATTEIYTLSLHDALPILDRGVDRKTRVALPVAQDRTAAERPRGGGGDGRRLERLQDRRGRSEEHTSEFQSRQYLVCRLLL